MRVICDLTNSSGVIAIHPYCSSRSISMGIRGTDVRSEFGVSVAVQRWHPLIWIAGQDSSAWVRHARRSFVLNVCFFLIPGSRDQCVVLNSGCRSDRRLKYPGISWHPSARLSWSAVDFDFVNLGVAIYGLEKFEDRGGGVCSSGFQAFFWFDHFQSPLTRHDCGTV